MRTERRARSESSSSTSSTSSSSCSTLTKDRYHIIVMGAAAVGKTCIVSRFLYEQFLSEYKATVEELHRGEYEINGMPLTLDILDTSGSYEFPAMRKLSISTGDAFILVYSVDDTASFEEIKNIRQQIIDQKNDHMTPIVIVGNKTDIDKQRRVICRETAETTVNIEWGNGYVEVSAKDNTNIVGIFQELLAQANVQIALSPAVRRRRESLPNAGQRRDKSKRNSCCIS